MQHGPWQQLEARIASNKARPPLINVRTSSINAMNLIGPVRKSRKKDMMKPTTPKMSPTTPSEISTQ